MLQISLSPVERSTFFDILDFSSEACRTSWKDLLMRFDENTFLKEHESRILTLSQAKHLAYVFLPDTPSHRYTLPAQLVAQNEGLLRIIQAYQKVYPAISYQPKVLTKHIRHVWTLDFWMPLIEKAADCPEALGDFELAAALRWGSISEVAERVLSPEAAEALLATWMTLSATSYESPDFERLASDLVDTATAQCRDMASKTSACALLHYLCLSAVVRKTPRSEAGSPLKQHLLLSFLQAYTLEEIPPAVLKDIPSLFYDHRMVPFEIPPHLAQKLAAIDACTDFSMPSSWGLYPEHHGRWRRSVASAGILSPPPHPVQIASAMDWLCESSSIEQLPSLNFSRALVVARHDGTAQWIYNMEEMLQLYFTYLPSLADGSEIPALWIREASSNGILPRLLRDFGFMLALAIFYNVSACILHAEPVLKIMLERHPLCMGWKMCTPFYDTMIAEYIPATLLPLPTRKRSPPLEASASNGSDRLSLDPSINLAKRRR